MTDRLAGTRDAQCVHEGAGWVSWPPITRPGVDTPDASTYCCNQRRCIREAQQWVEERTGHAGIFVPFPTKARKEKTWGGGNLRWTRSALKRRSGTT